MKNIYIGLICLVAVLAIAQQDANRKWTSTNKDKDMYPSAVACSADGKTVYVIAKNGHVYGGSILLVSNDGGQVWRAIQP